jgi:hypothetical protein
MWTDINKVYLFDDYPTSFSKLPRTVERFDASRLFAGNTPFEFEPSKANFAYKLKMRSWFNWAAIVALPSISVDDPLHRDLIDLGVGDQWVSSPEREALSSDPLLAVLFELRNYEVHVEFRPSEVKKFQAQFGSERQGNSEKNFVDRDAIFIAPIDFISLSKLRNVKSGRSKITEDMVDWFNRQARTWPASYLIGVARERYAKYISKYLERNGID